MTIAQFSRDDILIYRGREEGREEGRIEMLIQLVNDGDFTVEKAAAKVNMTSEDFLKKREEYKKETL